MLPASFSGGLSSLIDRLQSGAASAEDQAFAARLLAASERAIPVRLRRAYVETTAAQHQMIYMDVCAELARAGDDDVRRACAVVAPRYEPKRNDSGELRPTLNPATVEKIYEEQGRLEDALAEWRKQTPLMQSISAEENGALDRMRLESYVAGVLNKTSEAEAAQRWRDVCPEADESPQWAEWLEFLAAYTARNAM